MLARLKNLSARKSCRSFRHLSSEKIFSSSFRPLPDQKTTSEILSEYNQLYNFAKDNPEKFWSENSKGIYWHKPWSRVYDKNKIYTSRDPNADWFENGQTNACYNAVDRHAESTPNDIAIITESDVSGQVKHHTYQELHQKVEKLAAVLTNNGVKPGDTVIIYMPMIVEAAVAMMATARIGAVHAVVFGGFAAKELATRMKHVGCKVVLTANGSMEGQRPVNYLEMVNDACKIANFNKQKVICYDRIELQNVTDLPMSTSYGFKSMADQLDISPSAKQDCIWVDSQHPLYILYTSGTTGQPKGVVRPTGGYLVALHWSFINLFGIPYKDQVQRWFSAADVGWIVGHTYTIYGPLINGNTTLIYEGKPVNGKKAPNHEPLFKLIDDHKIHKSFVSPTAMRAVRSAAAKANDPDCSLVREKYKSLDGFKKFNQMYIAGEHCEVDTLKWTENAFQCESYDNWWQSEVGWPLTSPVVELSERKDRNVAFPQPKGSTGLPVPGWNVSVDDKTGQILIKLPMPPGAFNSLWDAHDRYLDHYFQNFPGYYDSMDSGMQDENGFVTVFSRVDDVINVAGHRLSSGQIEEALCNEKGIYEAAVVGQKDSLKGQIPVAFIISENDKVIEKAIKRVSDEIGRFSRIEKFYRVEKLPKTRSGKTPRKTLLQLVDGKEIQIPGTIEDESVYEDLKRVVGYGEKTKK